jgi:hypothetical protein
VLKARANHSEGIGPLDKWKWTERLRLRHLYTGGKPAGFDGGQIAGTRPVLAPREQQTDASPAKRSEISSWEFWRELLSDPDYWRGIGDANG